MSGMGSSLDSKVAIITGAASGQGRAAAGRFVAEGARVVVTDIDEDRGATVAADLGAAAVFHRLDVGTEAAWDAVVNRATDTWGRIDILVNNAGAASAKLFWDLSADDFLDVVRVNELGTFLGMRAVAPVMMSQRRGSIINISSVAARAATPRALPYVATKAAIAAMTRAAALELAGHGVRVNCVLPGMVDTPLLRRALGDRDGAVAAAAGAAVPLARAATPDEVAALMLFLAGDESSYATGAEFVLDGGWSVRL